MSPNKKIKSLRSLGRIHAGRLRHYAPHVCAPYLKVRCRMNPVRFFTKEFTKAKYKYLNKAIIENINTDLFNEILEQLLGNGWVKLYEYDAIDAWIDFGKVKIRKDNTTLVFEWDNYMEGVIIGSKNEIEQVAKQFRLQSNSVPSYINENAK
tara:strand:+ start:526 stop:981 length:456 start_codon:yes stop_codon:yes gene_type:complete